MLKKTLLAGSVLIATEAAYAAGEGPFGVKTMREPFAAHEAQRPLMLPKGWLEFNLGYDRKMGSGAWSPEGEVVAWEHARWTHQTGRFALRVGLSPRVELAVELPYHVAALTNDMLGTDLRDRGAGDPKMSMRYKLFEGQVPSTQVVAEAVYKAPGGQEAPGTFIGGPNNMQSLVFSTGTPDLTVGLAAKTAVGPLFFTGRAGYKKRFSAIVQYLVEADRHQFSGRMRPGDELSAEVGANFQAGPVALGVGARAKHRAVTRIGTTSPGWDPSTNLDAVVGSDGFALDATSELVVNFGRGFDVSATASFPLMGEDLQFFPIEDLQPTYGPTIGGAVEIRY